MKKVVSLLVIASIFLVGCQPIEDWQTVGEQTASQTIKGNQLADPVSLAFQTTSFTFQSVSMKENQLLVSVEWVNEGDQAQAFSTGYATFSAYVDDQQLTPSTPAPSKNEKIAVGSKQQLTFTFEMLPDTQQSKLLFEVEPVDEKAKHFDMFLE